MADMGRFYVVDPTAPSAEAFLSGLCRTLTGWGYRYLKFDFVRSLVLSEDAVFHDRSRDRAQAYRRGLEILRRAAGDDTMIGIWGGLYEANAGLVDINRSGSDVRGHWDPVRDYGYGTRYPVRMRQTFARAFYDEKLWTSDQDALQLRRRDIPWRSAKPHLSMGVFSDEEAFSTVVYRFLGGGVVQVSEKLDELAQDRYDLYKIVIPTYAPVAQRFGGWDEYLPEYFASYFGSHESLPPWVVVTLCNWNGKAAKKMAFRVADVPKLPKANRYAAFEFRTQKFLGVFRLQDTVQLELDAHGSRVIRVTPLRADGRYLIGTDLNLSGGMEIERATGDTVMLKPAEVGFAARVTFLDWKHGKAAVQVVEHKAKQ
jgi:alpha-galactosidase